MQNSNKIMSKQNVHMSKTMQCQEKRFQFNRGLHFNYRNATTYRAIFFEIKDPFNNHLI